MKLIYGSASKKLALELAQKLDITPILSETIVFKNSELRVSIKEEDEETDYFVLQSTSQPVNDHLLELALICDRLSSRPQNKITAIIPYFGYSRQSRAHSQGEAVSGRVAAKLIEASGAQALLTIDIHDEDTEHHFSIPFKSLSAMPMLAESLSKKLDKKSVVIVSPDKGGLMRCKEFGKAFFGHDNFDIAEFEKSRGETPHSAKIIGFQGDVRGKTAIIVDDIISSGSTLFPVVEHCLKNGATEIYAAVTHADFIEGVADRLQSSPLKELLITDTIDFNETPFSKITKLSVSSLIANSLVTRK